MKCKHLKKFSVNCNLSNPTSFDCILCISAGTREDITDILKLVQYFNIPVGITDSFLAYCVRLADRIEMLSSFISEQYPEQVEKIRKDRQRKDHLQHKMMIDRLKSLLKGDDSYVT